MSETLAPRIETPDNESEISKLHAMMDAPAYEAPERTASLENEQPKPTLLSAAKRVVGFLEQRQVNKAHTEALQEYKDRDYNGYIDTIAAQSHNSEASETAQAFATNELMKEERKADREQMRETAVTKIRGIGRSVLRSLKSSGEITLGLTLVGADRVHETARSAKTFAVETVASGVQAVKNGAEAAGQKVTDTWSATEVLAGKAGVKAEAAITNGIENVVYTKDAVKQTLEYRRLEAGKRKEAALSRKYQRHARWFNLKRDSRKRAQEFIDSTQEKAEQTKRAAKIRTSAGRRALLAYRDAVDAHR